MLVAMGLAVDGCIVPADAYNAFVERAPAPDAAIVSAGDAGEACSDVLSGGPSGIFFGACLVTADYGDPTKATYVKLDVTVTAAPGASTGSITTQMTNLVLNPSNISQTTAPPAVPFAADCTYVVDAGTTTIAAAANSFGAPLVLANTVYRGKLLTADSSCADLDATITMPVNFNLELGGNTCVFRRAPADGAVTLFTASDFACPGAPGAPPM